MGAEGDSVEVRLLELATRLSQSEALRRFKLLVHDALLELRSGEQVVLVAPVEGLARGSLHPYLEGLAAGNHGALLVGAVEEAVIRRFPERAVLACLDHGAPLLSLEVALLGLHERLEMRAEAERDDRSLKRTQEELRELVDIARAISQERDIGRLLGRILERARLLTNADAGSIYVVEPIHEGAAAQQLRFKLSQNESVSFESSEMTMPIAKSSIAGAAAYTREAINIADVYDKEARGPYSFDRSFDRKIGYRTKSMLTVPMVSAEEEVLGVIQLINKRNGPSLPLTTEEAVDISVVPFDAHSEGLVLTLASQAGIALENALLYDEINRIFEGFVRASVQAIEQRDPTTSGHSLRVSVLCTGLAEKVDRADSGVYKRARFDAHQLRQLEYAALLHDFGKIGVREEVLVKAKKLYPHQLEHLEARFEQARLSIEVELLREKVALLQRGADAEALAALDQRRAGRLASLEEAWAAVRSANEPSVMQAEVLAELEALAQLSFTDARGDRRPLLLPEEIRSLSVRKGSLNDEEFDEIRSHVTHTFVFLSRIPWGKTFAEVPRIAGAHHEKLDGSGYPKRLKASEIPLPSKIMTVADIFDALTASDRPYKKAVPLERAMAILGYEVKDGKIDGELVRIFREAEVYKLLEQDLSY
jgi:HD-GYP domain-containing protein (c-di-GMP phosphodiesterase class II)